jgi:hypothetical protein
VFLAVSGVASVRHPTRGGNVEDSSWALQGPRSSPQHSGFTWPSGSGLAQWSGKTLTDHKADRMAFVAQALAAVGIEKPTQDTSRLIWRKLAPGDPNVPPRAHLLMQAIAERITWRAEYDRAMLAANAPPPSTANVSAIRQAA